MNLKERFNAVMHRENPDRVPFYYYHSQFRHGTFEREMRNKGLGILVPGVPLVRSFHGGDVKYETRIEGNITTKSIHTPVGTLSQRFEIDPGKLHYLHGRSRTLEPLIKTEADYDTAIYILDNQEFYADYQLYRQKEAEVGEDGIVRGIGISPPYQMTMQFFGFREMLPRWFVAQLRNPHEFDKLVRACERQVERELPFIQGSPCEVLALGSFNGYFGPRHFEKYCLPFYEKYSHILHKKGKILCSHAHAPTLKPLKHLIAKTGLDVIESYTLPPMSDFSIPEAREAWGDNMVIWANMPEAVFYEGAEYTKNYIRDLIRSDPPGNRLVIGAGEIGLQGTADERTEKVFKNGLRAVADAINQYGKYPVA